MTASTVPSTTAAAPQQQQNADGSLGSSASAASTASAQAVTATRPAGGSGTAPSMMLGLLRPGARSSAARMMLATKPLAAQAAFLTRPSARPAPPHPSAAPNDKCETPAPPQPPPLHQPLEQPQQEQRRHDHGKAAAAPSSTPAGPSNAPALQHSSAPMQPRPQVRIRARIPPHAAIYLMLHRRLTSAAHPRLLSRRRRAAARLAVPAWRTCCWSA